MSRVADPKAKIALLRAAEEVFAERGLAGAKVEDIARRAGLSKGAFYLHFESKEAALKHVVESFLAHCGTFFLPPSAYAELPRDAAEMIDFSLEQDLRIFDFLWESRAILRILGSCHGAYDYLVEAFRAELDETTRAWLEHDKSAGWLRADVDVDLATTLLTGAYNELCVRMLACGDRRPPLERWLAFAQSTFLHAYGNTEVIRAVSARENGASEHPRAKSGKSKDRGRVANGR